MLFQTMSTVRNESVKLLAKDVNGLQTINHDGVSGCSVHCLSVEKAVNVLSLRKRWVCKLSRCVIQPAAVRRALSSELVRNSCCLMIV
jgi:hypothetical protein